MRSDHYSATATAVNPPPSRQAFKRQRKKSAPTALFRLHEAWARATPAERAEFGRAVGVDVVWDEVVAPNLG
jgi:hypothetical protein